VEVTPALQQTPFAQKVLLPAIQAGTSIDKPATVYSLALAAIANKQVSIEEAVDGYTAVFQRGMAIQRDAVQLTKFGITPSKETFKYNAQVETKPNALWGRDEVIDNSDRMAVKAAMMKTLANKLMSDVNPSGWMQR
jgi:hypothetical protein